jgi:hypothetical protein
MSAHDPKQIFSLGVRPIGGFGFFTKTFDIGFRLIWCLVDVLADLGNALVFSRRLYVDDETRSVGARTIHQFAKAVSQAATRRTDVKRTLCSISLSRGR